MGGSTHPLVVPPAGAVSSLALFVVVLCAQTVNERLRGGLSFLPWRPPEEAFGFCRLGSCVSSLWLQVDAEGGREKVGEKRAIEIGGI